jgi:threonine aldolase
MDAEIDFRSDNVGPVAPEIMEALAATNSGAASAYGGDALTAEVKLRYSELFEADVEVFAVPTGTAANAISLSACTPPWGAIYCHVDAHANTSECGATEFFSHGAKLVPVTGEHGRIDAAALEEALRDSGRGQAHRSQPATVTLTQATEWGAVYSHAQLDELAEIARAHSMSIHMDGARFAGALASANCTPAQGSWRRGVDILSFGVTKNGGLLCDAVVVFRPDLAETLKYRLRRTGYGWSKMRFAAVQLLAYVQGDLWLHLARRANLLAERLARGLTTTGAARLIAPVEANEVFVRLSDAAAAALNRAKIRVHPRGDNIVRMVCRSDMADADITRCIAAVTENHGIEKRAN